MCGIVGFNWPDGRQVKIMADALRHRGPDDEGFFVDDEVSLGHRRLSIIDLSEAGRQPMEYDHGPRRAIVTFNGEIFNYREVRRSLEAQGHRFRTASDTEVVLAAYLEWGDDCVDRFNGMWAFAIYDPPQRRLLLSRDRFGEKPLHYHLRDGQFVFASEVKAILAHPVRRRANREIVADYLYNGSANGSLQSFFEDVRMLPPAHSAVFDLRSRTMSSRRYYQPRRGSRRVRPDEFREVLKRSVERRLVADVPVSISLSGGTDSTSVAALMAQLTAAPVKAFTTATDEGIGDETSLVSNFVARYPQFELERSGLSGARFGAHYREIIFHMDEPFARQSAYVRWEIANLTRHHGRKVLLNGEGADEILGGYPAFVPQFLRHLLHRLNLIRFWRELGSALTHPDRRKFAQAFRADVLARRDRAAARDDAAREFRRKFQISLEPARRHVVRFDDIKDYLFWLVHDYSLPRLLNCNDKMSMANSVEGRAPFLDHEFVDMAFSMDPADLIVNGWRKYPLRQAMDGLVPDEILFRKSKDAFHAPIFDYLRGDAMQRRVRELFREPRTASVFGPHAYLAEYEGFLSRRGADHLFLLHGLFLEEWARMFEVDLE